MSLLQRVLKAFSGGSETIISQQLIFNKVIGVKGLTAGAGTSTIVQALAYYYSINKQMRVCVIDTSFLHPIQEALLGATKPAVDILQYTGDIAQLTAKTKFKNVYLVSLWNRGIVDMIDKDNSAIYVEVLKQLKTYFDVILVDLCNEYTDLNTTAAIKCNRIITVADQSNKCIYHVRNTLNTNATIAIAREKQRITILNKTVKDVKTSTVQSLEESGLRVVAEIPYSRHVAWFGITGEPCYRKTSESEEHEAFNKAITLIAESFIEKNPTNAPLHGDSTYKGEVVGEEKEEVKGARALKMLNRRKAKQEKSSVLQEKQNEHNNTVEEEWVETVSVTEHYNDFENDIDDFEDDTDYVDHKPVQPQRPVQSQRPIQQQQVPRKIPKEDVLKDSNWEEDNVEEEMSIFD